MKQQCLLPPSEFCEKGQCRCHKSAMQWILWQMPILYKFFTYRSGCLFLKLAVAIVSIPYCTARSGWVFATVERSIRWNHSTGTQSLAAAPEGRRPRNTPQNMLLCSIEPYFPPTQPTDWVSESVSQWVTRSPIELFWTAKNTNKDAYLRAFYRTLQWQMFARNTYKRLGSKLTDFGCVCECCKWCQQTVKVCSYSFFRSCQSGNVVGCSAIVHFPEFKKRKNQMMLMSTGADVWVCSSALAFPRSTSIFLDFTIWRTKECECI